MYMYTRKGYVPPVAAFKAATKENREAFGIAVSIDNQIIIQQDTLDWDNEEAAIKQLVDFAESYKEGTAMYWFSDSIVRTAQPYELFGIDMPVNPEKPDGEQTHQVFGVACFAGDFDKHDDNGPESPEFNCFTNLVKPRSEKISEEVNKHLKEGEDPVLKFQEYLHNNNENRDNFMQGVLSETSSITLLIVDALFMTFEGTDVPSKSYAWGYMSNPYDYVEMPNKQGSVPVVKPKVGATLVPRGKNITAEIDKAIGSVTLISVHPPKSFRTSKDLVQFYQTHNHAKDKDGKGLVPEDFLKRPAVEVDKTKWDATFSGKVPAATTATAVPPTAGIVTKKNSAQTSTEPKPFVPMMSPKELAALTEGWLKHGYINPNITTAKSLAAKDYKVPTFAEQTGVSLSDLAGQPPESVHYLVERHPILSTNLIMELIRMNIAGQKITAPATSKQTVKTTLVPKKVA
jgi:hypothetical protein